MGEIVRINAGSKARGFEGVDKLRTQLSGGGKCLWVPSHAVRLGTKRVTENGTYSAADEQLYGYSSVEVNVNAEVDQLTGKGQDGNDYSVTKDGSGGLVETKVPSEIRVTTLPNTLTYEVGSALSFDGIEVTAYYGDGSVYGVIPSENLIFPVTQAPMETYDGPQYSFSSDLDTGDFTQPIPSQKSYLFTNRNNDNTLSFTTSVASFIVTQTNNSKSLFIATRQTGIVYHQTNHHPRAPETDINYDLSADDHSITIDGKTVYYKRDIGVSGWQTEGVIVPVSSLTERQIANAMWTLMYGDFSGSSGGYQIPVQWNRPGDGLTLETSYGITVTAITGGGGQAGDNGTGRND